MAIFTSFQLQIKLSTLLVVFIYMIIFIISSQAAYQVSSTSFTTKPGMFLPRKMQQQHKFVTEALKETHQPQQDLGKVTPPMVDEWQLRMVPSGPDPLHHHRTAPKRPQTP